MSRIEHPLIDLHERKYRSAGAVNETWAVVYLREAKLFEAIQGEYYVSQGGKIRLMIVEVIKWLEANISGRAYTSGWCHYYSDASHELDAYCVMFENPSEAFACRLRWT